MFLLFAKGKRPTIGDIKEFAANSPSVSLVHDPSAGAPIRLASDHGETVAEDGSGARLAHEGSWVELLREGLAFDLDGLAPGDGFAVPEVEHLFDLQEQPGPARFEALHLTPGHHLAGGERAMPVAKGLIALACDLVQHFSGIEAVAWPPARSASSRQYFESVVTAWLGGGPFPALGLTAFRQTFDGALQSVGLDFWLDQELRIEPPLSTDKVASTRLGVRLINQLVIVGGVEGSERIVAPDGSRLVLRPSRNGKFIRVWRE
ncbi:hypothetical protein CD351_09340 [Erythrobacter sp. KY5]|uniref:hypothetical protein n=1 Tax=Erythrobacter sp. KY5 TaxID=2011159 RepID=UPI000DBF21F9|nr:hypothetical protein [Erythrobacter sp. KY5]AWW74624.1 hypothetical protein CD351_09340 [Erythrobacter sp. KY5]